MTQQVSISAALGQRMNFLAARQGVIAGNIANADTPGFLARDLTEPTPLPGRTFAMRITNAKHLGGNQPGGNAGQVVEDRRFVQHNGNSVRLDQEMLKQQETTLEYRLMTQLYSKQVQLQQLALGRGGGR